METTKRGLRQTRSGSLIVSLTSQPGDQRLKRLARPILDQAAQIQPAIHELHRTVHRSEQHLAGEHLQALTHHRWIVHRLARASRYHSHHHDLPRRGTNARRVRRHSHELLQETYQSTTNSALV